MHTLNDGTRLQAGLAQAEIYGRLPDYNLYGVFLECVVVAIRFPNDLDNHTGMVEYDCDPLVPGVGRVFNAIYGSQGLDDGEEEILRVAKAKVDGSAWNKDPGNDRRWEADGDWVLVTFINGSKDRPIIIRRLTHPSSKAITASPADVAHPRTKTVKHRGTTVQLDGQGNVAISLGSNQDKTDPTDNLKKIVITVGSTPITISNSVTGPTIDFGDGAGEHVVLGDALMSQLATMSTQLVNLTAHLVSHTHIGNLGAPAIPDPVSTGTFTADGVLFTGDNTAFALPAVTNLMLSNWIKTKKVP